MALVATLSLGLKVLDFNGGRILAGIHYSCDELRMCFVRVHAIPDGLVLGPSTEKSSHIYLQSNHQGEFAEQAKGNGGT